MIIKAKNHHKSRQLHRKNTEEDEKQNQMTTATSLDHHLNFNSSVSLMEKPSNNNNIISELQQKSARNTNTNYTNINMNSKTDISEKQIRSQQQLNNIIKEPKKLPFLKPIRQSLDFTNSKFSKSHSQLPSSSLSQNYQKSQQKILELDFSQQQQFEKTSLQILDEEQQIQQKKENQRYENNSNSKSNNYQQNSRKSQKFSQIPGSQNNNSKVYISKSVLPRKSNRGSLFNNTVSNNNNNFKRIGNNKNSTIQRNFPKNNNQNNIFQKTEVVNGNKTSINMFGLQKQMSTQNQNLVKKNMFNPNNTTTVSQQQKEKWGEKSMIYNSLEKLKPLSQQELNSASYFNAFETQYNKNYQSKTEQNIPDIREINIIENLTSNQAENDFQEEFSKTLDGSKKFQDFFQHYKKQDKIQDVDSISSQYISPFMKMVKESQRKKVFPKKYNLFTQEGVNKKVQNSHFRLGDTQGEFFSAGLKQFQNDIEELDLTQNDLSEQGMFLILQSVSKKYIEKMNLSYNKFGINSCYLISKIIDSKSSSLCYLNLEGNNLGDQNVKTIIDAAVRINSSLKYLNLSKNKLTHEVCKDLKTYLQENNYLSELYLHWNNIQTKGFLLIGEGLLENGNLKVLDLSYNSIGAKQSSNSDPEMELLSAQVWQQAFERDQKLEILHLDLSYNRFSLQQSQILSDGLEKNHTIYGLHWRGNEGQVTCKGFLNVQRDAQSQSEQQFQKYVQEKEETHIGEWQIMSRIEGVKTQRVHKYIQNCWICEGWVEVKFEWIPMQSGPVKHGPIFIHFDFDEFMPHQMIFNEHERFVLKKMCPPDCVVSYFFTAAGNQLVGADQLQNKHNYDDVISIQFADTVLTCKLSKLNYRKTGKNYCLIEEDNYMVNAEVKPRRYEKINFLPPKEEIKIPWSFENSIFRTYKKDDEALLNSCFEFDWSCCKIDKLLKTQESEIKEYFRSKYALIKNTYNYYASLNPTSDIWSLSNNVYADALTMARIVDINYGLKDADFNFIATNSGLEKWKQSNNPQRAVVRFQFIEVFIRNIIDKFYKTQIIPDLFEAIQAAFDEGISEFILSVTNEHEWKENVYWNEYNDSCLQNYIKIVEYVFKKYAGCKNPKTLIKGKFMIFKDFQHFTSDSGLAEGDKITERDINLAFNLAGMTQIDELTKSRHLELQLVEFYESLARLADSQNPVPYGEEEENWPLEKRENLPLHVKLESLILQLNARYLHQDKVFRDENPLPKKSMFLEVIQDCLENKSMSNSGSQINFNRRSMIKKQRQSRVSIQGAPLLQGLKKMSIQQQQKNRRVSNFQGMDQSTKGSQTQRQQNGESFRIQNNSKLINNNTSSNNNNNNNKSRNSIPSLGNISNFSPQKGQNPISRGSVGNAQSSGRQQREVNNKYPQRELYAIPTSAMGEEDDNDGNNMTDIKNTKLQDTLEEMSFDEDSQSEIDNTIEDGSDSQRITLMNNTNNNLDNSIKTPKSSLNNNISNLISIQTQQQQQPQMNSTGYKKSSFMNL